jgi:branched-chain amino acid transport system ATP-binding protein
VTALDRGTAAVGTITPVLRAKGLCAGYGGVSVIADVDLEVLPGEIVALLGINGAGKTTTVRALSGQIKPTGGEVHFLGSPTTAPMHRRAKAGMRVITEERSAIMGLTVAENLRLGGQSKERCLELFPELRRLMDRRAGLLSGGEQQILALARAIAAEPAVLLADELSLGLAPLVCERLLIALRAAADAGTGVLLVEQRVRDALEFADRASVLSNGSVVLSGTAAEIAGRMDEIERTYLDSSALTTRTSELDGIRQHRGSGEAPRGSH